MHKITKGKILILILIFSIPSFIGYAIDSQSNYIGLKYRDCPGGLIYEGGTVIGDKLQYAVSYYLKNSTHMIWLEKIYDHDKNGRAILEVLDVIISPIKNKEYIFCDYCLINDQYQPYTFALVRREDQEFYSIIKYAWKIDFKQMKFTEISILGMKCFNESTVTE